MNITCDSCQARYTISDEKVTGEGRVFKVQCKQCGAQIIVEGISEAAAPQSTNSQPADPWFYAVGQDRQGPVSREALAGLLADGTVSASTYVWCDGMDDWAVIGDIDSLKDLVQPGPVDESDSSAVNSDDANVVSSESVEVSETPDAEGSQESSSDNLFSFEDTDKAPRTSVHGRRDSSVLFSLDELSSFEEPRAQDPQSFLTETSGLIDIRGLANSHQAQAEDADNPFLSATGGASSSKPSFSLSYVPVVPRKRSPWPWVIGVAAVLVIGVGVTLAVVGLGGDDDTSTKKSKGEVAERAAEAPADEQVNKSEPEGAENKTQAIASSKSGSSAGSEDKKVAIAPTVTEKPIAQDSPEPPLKEDKGAVPVEPSKIEAKDAPAKVTAKKPAARTSRQGGRRVVAKNPPVTKAVPPKPQPKVELPKQPSADKKKNSRGVNDLLSSLSGKKKVKTTNGGGGGEGPKTLTSATVRSRVGARKARFKTCYKMQPNRSPTGVNVTLRFTIKNSGSVGAARVAGGGLTGGVQSCILRALKSIRFPVFRDPEKKVTYPLFLL